jgi:hypothetical protein
MKWLSRFFSIVKFIFFQRGFSWIKYVVRGCNIIAPCPINCAWWAESNDTTLDFLAPPEDPLPTLPVIDRFLSQFWLSFYSVYIQFQLTDPTLVFMNPTYPILRLRISFWTLLSSLYYVIVQKIVLWKSFYRFVSAKTLEPTAHKIMLHN